MDRRQQRLRQGAVALNLHLSDQQVAQLLAYINAFAKWNSAYNLSAVRDPEQMIGRHLLDSLAVAPHLVGNRIIDVGTGGGLPGIPLAIYFPEKHFTLLDSNGKKTRFLFHVKTELGLNNIQIENCRVEAHQPEQKYQAVISRAFASIADMTSACRHLLDDNGLYLAMKGVYPQSELQEAADLCRLVQSIRLQVPEEDGERHLLQLAPV